MTTRWMIALIVAASFAAGAQTFAQVQVWPGPSPLVRRDVPTCPGDTPAQLEARSVALDAVGQINRAARRYKMAHGAYPSWKELGDAPPLRPSGGPNLDWGADEPVRDWRIHYVSDRDAYVFTLTGLRDKCRVTFVSDDSESILDGREIEQTGKLVPLGTR